MKKKTRRRHPSWPPYEQLVQRDGVRGNQIGRAGEIRVVKAFHISGCPDWLVGCIRRGTEEEDRRKIDHVVFVRLDGEAGEIRIQVKTTVDPNRYNRPRSERAAEHGRYAKNNDPVRVYIHLSMSDAEVRAEIIRAIMPVYEEMLKEHRRREQTREPAAHPS